jgi:hypothetical protein
MNYSCNATTASGMLLPPFGYLSHTSTSIAFPFQRLCNLNIIYRQVAKNQRIMLVIDNRAQISSIFT